MQRNFIFLFQEVDKVLVVDFPFVTEQISNEISDENLTISVGAPILNELDAVSVKPIEAVQRLSDSKELCSCHSHSQTLIFFFTMAKHKGNHAVQLVAN